MRLLFKVNHNCCLTVVRSDFEKALLLLEVLTSVANSWVANSRVTSPFVELVRRKTLWSKFCVSFLQTWFQMKQTVFLSYKLCFKWNKQKLNFFLFLWAQNTIWNKRNLWPKRLHRLQRLCKERKRQQPLQKVNQTATKKKCITPAWFERVLFFKKIEVGTKKKYTPGCLQSISLEFQELR